MFLKTRIIDSFRLCYEGDPAIISKKANGEDPAWIDESKAKLKSGKKADVVVCRPLNADEVLRLVDAVERDRSAIIYASQMSVTAIERGDGKIVSDPEEIRSILNLPGNLEAICALGIKVFDVSREGEDKLPFRTKSADTI